MLAVVGPLVAGTRPTPAVVLGAVAVSVGAALVAGAGRADAAGIGWAAVVLACEVAFTLLAVPVLGRLGAWSVSLWTVSGSPPPRWPCSAWSSRARPP